MKERREEWREEQEDLDESKLVFLDESGGNTGMTRLYGRAPRKQRVVDAVADVRFARTAILSPMRLDGTIVPCVFEGGLNGALFREYIQHFLVPTLRPGDIVVMDNLSCHKVSGIVEAMEAVGAKVKYLPPVQPRSEPD